jgi:putative hydrolase of the HAD superfamily
MIKTIIFDFGNVFVNLDLEGAYQNALKAFQIESLSTEMLGFNSFYEQGLISTEEFIDFYTDNFQNISKEALIEVWNFMLKDFPKYRLDFLKELNNSSKFNLILLSNTNALHIEYIKEHVPFYEEFKNCFDAFYLSHVIHLVKPNKDIFEFVLAENKIKAEECLFIDDNLDNIKTANLLNFHTWHIHPEKDDVINLFKTKKHLFNGN